MSAFGPVADYLARLERCLDGSRRHRRRVLAEVEDHLTAAIADGVESGRSPEEATRAALERFGAPEQAARQLAPAGDGTRGRALALAAAAALGGAVAIAVSHTTTGSVATPAGRPVLIDNGLGGRVAITTTARHDAHRGLLTAVFELNGRPLAHRRVNVSPLTGGRTLVSYTDGSGRAEFLVRTGCYAVKLAGTAMPALEVPSPANRTFRFRVYTVQMT